MFDWRRTHTCGELRKTNLNESVTLSGWVHRYRNHGHLIFIDLRDRYGITQVVFDPNIAKEFHKMAKEVRSEWVISIKGRVISRGENAKNPNLPTGEIEVQVESFDVLSQSKTPPFSIADDEEISEELRLKYRYLDIRKGKIASNLLLRHEAMLAIRNYFDAQNFIEISTPILSKSTPEGARDYLVPSRISHGQFYALPQSPQMFKQILMIAGMDRYFQIAQCFRDEDLRADRQPEFTQIDIEMSFATPEELFKIIEGLMKEIFSKCISQTISTPFPKMSYRQAIENYGSDKPDLRFGMPLIRFDEEAKNSSYGVFQEVLKDGGIVKGFLVGKGSDQLSRKKIEELEEFVKGFGLKGLSYMKKGTEGWSGSIAKFFPQDQLQKITINTQAANGDVLLIAAGKEKSVNQGLDHLRRRLGKELGLIDPSLLKFCWITEFPMFCFDEEEQKIQSEHHPFTSPVFKDFSLLETDPLKVRAEAYDLVLNGYELASGSQRIHSSDLQKKIFEILQYTDQEILAKFGFFIDALNYGTPPHLGAALGLDRIIMLLSGTDNIRDVIAFPKTQKAADLMTQSPSTVSDRQLNELKIMVRK